MIIIPSRHVRAPQAVPQRPGIGARLTHTPFGDVIAASDKGARFPARFGASLSGDGLRFSRGVVNFQYEPKIGDKPVSGIAGGVQPVLKLSAKLASADGESWACVRVTPGADGSLSAKEAKIEMVHDSVPMVTSGPNGQIAVALILWKAGVPARVEQLTWFNFIYQHVSPATAGGKARHYFQ